MGSRIKLLGVLWGGPMHTAAGQIKVVPTPTNNELAIQSAIPTNLGFCIKAEEILKLETALSAKYM